MSNYQIITDSCCDFTKAQYRDLDVKYVPLILNYKGQSIPGYTEADELHAFYDGIREGEMPTTAAANCGFNDYAGFYRAFSAEYGITPAEYVRNRK